MEEKYYVKNSMSNSAIMKPYINLIKDYYNIINDLDKDFDIEKIKFDDNYETLSGTILNICRNSSSLKSILEENKDKDKVKNILSRLQELYDLYLKLLKSKYSDLIGQKIFLYSGLAEFKTIKKKEIFTFKKCLDTTINPSVVFNNKYIINIVTNINSPMIPIIDICTMKSSEIFGINNKMSNEFEIFILPYTDYYIKYYSIDKPVYYKENSYYKEIDLDFFKKYTNKYRLFGILLNKKFEALPFEIYYDDGYINVKNFIKYLENVVKEEKEGEYRTDYSYVFNIYKQNILSKKKEILNKDDLTDIYINLKNIDKNDSEKILSEKNMVFDGKYMFIKMISLYNDGDEDEKYDIAELYKKDKNITEGGNYYYKYNKYNNKLKNLI